MNNSQTHICGVKLDSYSILICSKYFMKTSDYINVMCVNSKFKETTEKLRYNPIPIKSLTLFPKIQTQYLYNENDIKIDGIEKYEVCYKVNYDHYMNYKEDNVKYHYIQYTNANRLKYGETIPNNVNILVGRCYEKSLIETMVVPNHVTSIGFSCFNRCYHLQSVTLSTGLTKLCSNCFDRCTSLTSIIIPSSIKTFGNDCFYGCNYIKSIAIPNSVTSIGRGCFYYCGSLKSITLPTSLNILEIESFKECSSLKNIELPTSLKSIGYDCFYKCKSLTTITLPDSLIYIEKESFSGCGIKTIEIPNSVKSIGLNCFRDCTSLTNLQIQSNIKEFTFKVSYNDSILYKKSNINCSNIVLTDNDVRNQLFQMRYQQNFKHDFIVPTEVVEIGDRTFYFNETIQSITIPTTVTKIGNDCFQYCNGLTSISIPNSVQSIGYCCFGTCSNLKQIKLPLNENNKYPFKITYSEYVILNQFGISCEQNVIFNKLDYWKYKLVTTNAPLILNIDENTRRKDISSNVVGLKSKFLSAVAKRIIIPTNVTYLGDTCFKDYSKLKSITLHTSIKHIGKHIIDGCTSLIQLNYDGDWNDIVVSYDDHLIFKLNGLLFNNIEYTNNDKMKYGTIPPSIVHSLNTSYYDRSCEIIHIPTHITTLDNNMFDYIYQEVEYGRKYKVISHLRSICIPTSIQTIPKYCFSTCYFLTKVSLPSTLTSIKKKAFSNCISLQSIDIPTSIINIDEYAFEYCYSLISITLPSSITFFGIGCFKECDHLLNVLNVPKHCF